MAPRTSRARYGRALALLGLDRLREAAREIEEVLELRDEPAYRLTGAGIYERLAAEYNRRGIRTQVYRSLRRAAELLPAPGSVPSITHTLEDLEKDFRGRVEQLTAILGKDRSDGGAWVQLAATYAAYGHYAEAERIFNDIFGQAERAGQEPPVEALLPYAFYFWQWRDTEEGYRRAAEIYREVLERDPDLPEPLEQLEACNRALSEGDHR
jgi:tetratricopeptide (TPR) repeat protein